MGKYRIITQIKRENYKIITSITGNIPPRVGEEILIPFKGRYKIKNIIYHTVGGDNKELSSDLEIIVKKMNTCGIRIEYS